MKERRWLLPLDSFAIQLNYKSHTVLRCWRMARRTFIQNAPAKYSTMGEPNVKNDAYTNDSRTLRVLNPQLLANAEHKPNDCVSR